MRLPVLVLVAASGLAAGLGFGSAPAAVTAPPSAGGTYPLHLKFDLLYQVDWSRSSGLEGVSQDSCASWSKERGITTVIAQDAPWRRSGERRAKRHGMPGSLMVYGSGQAATWATGAIVGRAKGTVNRRWIQQGGPTEGDLAGPCKGQYGGPPWRPVPTDCGGRSFTTKTATFVPQERRRMGTLDQLMTISGIPRQDNTDVFAIGVAPSRDPYRSCKAPYPAPAFPTNLGARVTIDNTFGLRARELKPGSTITGDFTRTGECDDDLPDSTTCTFKIHVEWELTRWAPGQRFP